jgi:alpha-1,6-mannosyltransferase
LGAHGEMNERRDRNGRWLWRALVVLLEAAFIGLIRQPEGAGASLLRCLAWLSAAALVYLIAVILTLRPTRVGAPSLRLLFWSALVFRLTLLPLTPQLSQIALRNQWEGRIQHVGFNPYPYSPSNSLFAPLQPPVNLPAPRLAAWRPPLAEILVHWAFNLLRGVRRMKFAWVAVDMLLVLLLIRLLRARGQAPHWALLYAWSPLAVFEVAGNGQLIPAAVLLALLALAWSTQASKRAGAAAAAAALTGWMALLALPIVFAAAGRRWKGAAAWLAIVGALIWSPFLFFNRQLIFPAVWRNLRRHLAAPAFNASLFALLHAWFGSVAAWAVAAALVAAAFAGLWLGRKRAPFDPMRAAFAVSAVLILVLPHVHPNELLWLLPLVVFFPEPAWIYFSLAVLWSYVAARSTLGTCLEYAPLYALLVWQGWRARVAVRTATATP